MKYCARFKTLKRMHYGLDLTHKQLSVHPKFESFKHYLTFSSHFIVVMDTDIDGYKVKGWENDRL